MAKTGFKGQFVPLELQLDDGAVGKYPRALVYRATDNFLLADLVMGPGNTLGTYTALFLPTDSGYVYMIYKIYTSNLYNILDILYNIVEESAYIYDKTGDQQALVGKILDESLASHLSAGSVGAAIQAASANTGHSSSAFPVEFTVDRILKLDNLDAAVSTRATQTSLNAVRAVVDTISTAVYNLSQSIPSPANIWSYINRTLTAPVDTTLDISGLATATQLAVAKLEIISSLDIWEVKGSLAINKITDQLEIIAWLSKNGSTAFDATGSSVEIRDSDDNLIMSIGPDIMSTTSSGLFKFVRSGAAAIIFKNKTYVLNILITHAGNTYRGNVSVTTY